MLLVNIVYGQYSEQYFDGADTFYEDGSSIRITINNDSASVWRVGKPQKPIFNEASTVPNVLITDTINPYPPNDSSSFQFTTEAWDLYGILAIQWVQKLDIDTAGDGAIIEFSIDSGMTWQNVFNNPLVYSFYGFPSESIDTLADGTICLSGINDTWRDIWLCFDMSWLSSGPGELMLRFTLISDSVANTKDGWMIDNMLRHITYVHTISERKLENYCFSRIA